MDGSTQPADDESSSQADVFGDTLTDTLVGNDDLTPSSPAVPIPTTLARKRAASASPNKSGAAPSRPGEA
ncbi:hypothetical protein MVEN_01159400 [Mycena venus]|uniref:Uncharacterized protein n=1 Tax=Mycena venus TaxID=2733690 RepID=A0A8H7CYE2_9AGAR|nr:hypothetical protein MVEN_01159400 [Mycena venus]